MTMDDFVKACASASPPKGLEEPLLALYWDARGEWEKAHAVAQGIQGPVGSLVHAYLHRKEGDQSNARYWYGRAGRPVPGGALEEEWKAIAAELCA